MELPCGNPENMKTKTLLLIAAMFSLSGFLSAGENLDIKGSFDAGLTGGFPVGWLPNKPSWWDDAATVGLNPIDGTEKQALQVTSPNQGIHLFYVKKWPVVPGDQCVVRAMVKGTGSGQLGVYTYPGCVMSAKTFLATEEWTQFVAEVTIPKVNPALDEEIHAICVVLVANPNSSIEFLDVTAEIVKP
jgi:hypothetical protein